MEISIKGTREPTTIKNGRYTKTFTPTSKDELIKILHNDCIGTTRLSEIQIEKGKISTDYVEPSSTQDPISGIFKDLRGINIELKDPNSTLWSKITANNKAMITEFGDGRMSSAIGQTADTIRKEIKDSLDGKVSTFTQNINGFQQRVKDSAVDSAVSLVKGMYDVRLQTSESNYSRLTQSVNSLTSRVQTAEDTYSEMNQTIQGFRTRVENAEGQYSQAIQTIRGMETRVKDNVSESVTNQLSSIYNRRFSNIEGDISKVSQLASGLKTTVSGHNGLTSKVEQLAGQITNKVSRSDVTSIIGQSGDSIWLQIKDRVSTTLPAAKMTGDEIKTVINLSRDGVQIAGRQVSITGDTYIQKGIIDEAHIKSGVVSKLFADEVKANSVVAKAIAAQIGRFVNIDANSITSGKLSADRIGAGIISGRNGEWNLNTGRFYTGLYKNRTQLLDGKLTSLENNSKRIEIDNTGVNFYHGGGQKLGYIGRSLWDSTNNTNLDFKHDYATSMGISYVDKDNPNKYNSYVVYDMHNRSGLTHSSGAAISRMGYPIMHMEGAYFKKKVLIDGELTLGAYAQFRNGATFSGDINMSGYRKIVWGNEQVVIENLSLGLFIGVSKSYGRSGIIIKADGKVVIINNGITGPPLK